MVVFFQITNLMHNSFIFQQFMLHYAPQHVSNSTLLILRRTNCITTASGIVTLEIGERSYIIFNAFHTVVLRFNLLETVKHSS